MRKKDENKKIEEREALHRTIWSIANDLRRAVDSCSRQASQ